MVFYGREAWHSGRGEILVDGESRRFPNNWTIGVAFRNCGLLEDEGGRFYFRAGGRLLPYDGPDPVLARLEFDNGYSVEGFWQPYTAESIEALRLELEEIDRAGFARAARTLIGHEDTSMPLGNKIDPGPLFPWADLGIEHLNPRTRGVLL